MLLSPLSGVYCKHWLGRAHLFMPEIISKIPKDNPIWEELRRHEQYLLELKAENDNLKALIYDIIDNVSAATTFGWEGIQGGHLHSAWEKYFPNHKF